MNFNGNFGSNFDLYDGSWGGISVDLNYRINDKFNRLVTL